uniref:HK97 gp10 family phage protein n=1 Tax=Salmonella phage ZK22 TaxID=3240399 RepID=A0AB39U1J0_9CAUD
MPAKLRGIQEAIRKTEQIVGTITAEKAVRAIKSANYIIRTEAATITPIDTSTLINSQYDTVEVSGTRITGKVGYSAKYALYVHNASGKLAGKPRSNGNGTYWSPGGKPQFLTKAAQRTKDLVDSVIKKEMTL